MQTKQKKTYIKQYNKTGMTNKKFKNQETQKPIYLICQKKKKDLRL